MKQLWRYFMQRKKFWLIPLLLVFVLMATLIMLGPTNPYSPFVYTVF